jgi:RHS repeat-associated protein
MDAAVYYYHNDHLGTPQKLTDQSGAVVWSAVYSPYGKATIPLQLVTNNLRFAGQCYDAESGLHYNYHRYYDPKTGRYLTPDPIGLAGGVNPYVYVGNNPGNLIDLLGLWGEDVHSGIGNQRYGTFTWAQQEGFSGAQARRLALSNDAIDGGWGSWVPIFGLQSRHFNQGAYGDFQDSRLFWARYEFNRAIEAHEKGECDIALSHIGRGLHSLQDIYAHRDWDTGFLGWYTHPGWYDDWDDPRNAQAREMTQRVTENYLREFMRRTY